MANSQARCCASARASSAPSGLLTNRFLNTVSLFSCIFFLISISSAALTPVIYFRDCEITTGDCDLAGTGANPKPQTPTILPGMVEPVNTRFPLVRYSWDVEST